jgi:hypothetical protein
MAEKKPAWPGISEAQGGEGRWAARDLICTKASVARAGCTSKCVLFDLVFKALKSESFNNVQFVRNAGLPLCQGAVALGSSNFDQEKNP